MTSFDIREKEELEVPEVYIPLLAVIPSQTDIQTAAESVLRDEYNWTATTFEHPDLEWLNPVDENLTIEAVRKLPQVVSTHPLGPIRFIILTNLQSASAPAQNALLKILEEPPAGNQFILITTSLSQVLPTVRSRCEVKEFDFGKSEPNNSETKDLYQQLLTSSYAHLIKITEKYGDRVEAQTLVNRLISYVHSQPATQITVRHLQQLVKTQDALDKNVNVRLAMEDCFFNLKTAASK